MDRGIPHRLTRRQFLSFMGMGAATLGLAPGWLTRASAAVEEKTRKTLIVLFQRGGADGLNIVPPFSDPIYKQSRPSIAIEAPGKKSKTIDLDGRFGLHPCLSPLLPLWKDGRLAIVHAVGSPDSTRSHFDAQEYMESGTPGIRTTSDGWLSRALSAAEPGKTALDAVSISSVLPKTLRGASPVLVMDRVSQYQLTSGLEDSLESIYAQSEQKLFSQSGRIMSQARKELGSIAGFNQMEFEKAGYPRSSSLAENLHEFARLIKANAGLRVGFLEMGGWDHHVNEGSSAGGDMPTRLIDLGGSIAAFYRELSAHSEEVLLVTMTEFGRMLEQNLTVGTDHGHASVMMLFGGKVRGGKIHGRWPGLEKENLFEGRDLQVTTDFRQIISEVLVEHLKIEKLNAVFPGGSFPSIGLF